MKKTIEERFWSKVDKRGADECWEWVAYRLRDGYGQFKFNGSICRAHRVAWELINEPIPGCLCVLHACDNPPCCNPKHLFLGTRTVNNHDRDHKGRGAHGERNGSAKLTVEAIREIRSAAGLQKEIAARFGVDSSTVGLIKRRKIWQHIT